MFALLICVLCYLQQKKAYEMRISDWSSDVSSSDLGPGGAADLLVAAGTAGTDPDARPDLQQRRSRPDRLVQPALRDGHRRSRRATGGRTGPGRAARVLADRKSFV